MTTPELEFICYESFDQLPPEAVALFSRQWEREYFFQPRWFAYVVAHFFHVPEEFRVWLGRTAAGEPAMLFPSRRTLFDPKAMGGLCLQAASHWENAAPMGLMFNDTVAPPVEILAAFFRHLKSAGANGEGRPYDVLRLWPIDRSSELAGVIYLALRKAGYWAQAYKNSYNQYEDVTGKDYETYFEERSANFRYNLRRRRRKLERDYTLTFENYTPETLNEGMLGYEAVSRASWKVPHSMLGPVYFDLIDDSMAAGFGRLSNMMLDGRPVSTQFWIVSGGVAHIVRLAYDKSWEKLSVGLVHNAEMIRQVMVEGGVTEINYGYGSEPAKTKWTRQARVLYGVMAFNPRTPRGVYFALRNIIGSFVKQRLIRPVHLGLLDFLKRRKARRKAGGDGAG